MIRASELIWVGARRKMGLHPVGTVAFCPIFRVTASASRIFLFAETVTVSVGNLPVPTRFSSLCLCTEGDYAGKLN